MNASQALVPARRFRRAWLRLEVGVPIQEIQPGPMEIFARHMPLRRLINLMWHGLDRHGPQAQAALLKGPIALEKIIRLATSHHVRPTGDPTLGPWDDVVESEFLRRQGFGAILTAKPVAEEHMVSRKSNFPTLMEALECHNGRDRKGAACRVDLDIVIDNRVDPILQHRHQGILPRPNGEWPPTQGLHVSIQNQRLKIWDMGQRRHHGAGAVCDSESGHSDPPSGKATPFHPERVAWAYAMTQLLVIERRRKHH